MSAFRLPRGGADLAHCADAFAANRRTYRFAVADGATESYGSGIWARLLVRAWTYTRIEERDTIQPTLDRLAGAMERSWFRHDLPWYEEEKAQLGADAAFLGVQFSGRTGGPWIAAAVGDSCLFQEREGQVITTWPIEDPSDFGFHPLLIPSKSDRRPQWLESVAHKLGNADSGDVFWLMTDAIAHWYLQTVPNGRASRRDLHCACLATDDRALRILIARERLMQRMRNDDIAILRIELKGDD